MQQITITKLQKHAPCRDAIAWVRTQPNRQAAWDACERGDWMLWLLGSLSGKPESQQRKKLVLAMCDCASISLRKEHTVAARCISVTRDWAQGSAHITDVRAAAAYAAYAAYGGEVAAYAADAVDAGEVAADAADAVDATLKRCAQIVRKHYPHPPRF